MEDFRNFNDQNPNNNGINRLPRDLVAAPTSNEYGGIYDKPKAPKVGFIKARLNRDNFWNLMFWLGICSGIALSEIFDSILGVLISIIVLPKILTMFNPVTHIGEKSFTNSSGVSLDNNLPKQLDIVFLIMIVTTSFIFVPFFMLNGFILFHLTATTFIGFVISIPTLYFIFKNCPISILFNREGRCPEVTGLNSRPYVSAPTDNPYTSLDYYYRHWAGNIHNQTFKK